MDEKSKSGDKRHSLNAFLERRKSDGSVFDGRSNGSYADSAKKSKFSTMSKENLAKFFKDKKTKLDEDAQSRLS